MQYLWQDSIFKNLPNCPENLAGSWQQHVTWPEVRNVAAFPLSVRSVRWRPGAVAANRPKLSPSRSEPRRYTECFTPLFEFWVPFRKTCYLQSTSNAKNTDAGVLIKISANLLWNYVWVGKTIDHSNSRTFFVTVPLVVACSRLARMLQIFPNFLRRIFDTAGASNYF